MFPTRWITATDFFILRRGLENVMPEYLNFALAAAEKGLNSFETEQQKGYSPFTLKLEPFTIYKIGSCFNPQTKQVGDVYVSGTYELQMLIETYKWIDKHPDFAFGFDKKTIAEYEKEGVITKLKFEKLVEAWIMSMGLVNSEKDINWEVANMIFKPEKFETIMVDFFKGEASQDDVFQKVGFVDRTQAITCLNLKANIGEAEKRRMLDSLRKVKMFKVKNSSPYYLIYVMLFGYLKNHGSKLLKEDDLRKYSDLIPLVA